MRKICISIIGGFIMFSAFGAGENVPTSKSYIDSVLVNKQDAIERTNGNNQALTNTGTAGEYGTKDIYDSTGEYAAQQDALVDAATMNTAVQNAINAEFVCISWVDDDPSKDCLLMEIRGATERRSPNLFDKNDQRIIMDRWVYCGGGAVIGRNFYSLTQNKGSGFFMSAPIKIRSNKTYTVSNHKDKDISMSMPSFFLLDENFIVIDCVTNAQRLSVTFTVPNNDNIKYLIVPGHTSQMDVLQIEEGAVATPYQPYGNIYLPSGAE